MSPSHLKPASEPVGVRDRPIQQNREPFAMLSHLFDPRSLSALVSSISGNLELRSFCKIQFWSLLAWTSLSALILKSIRRFSIQLVIYTFLTTFLLRSEATPANRTLREEVTQQAVGAKTKSKSPLRLIVKRTWHGTLFFEDFLSCGHSTIRYAAEYATFIDGQLVQISPHEKRRRCAECQQETRISSNSTTLKPDCSKPVASEDHASVPWRLVFCTTSQKNSCPTMNSEKSSSGESMKCLAVANEPKEQVQPVKKASQRLYADCLEVVSRDEERVA